MHENSNARRVAAIIPEGLDFSDLRLSRDPETGGVDFEWQPIADICAANGFDPALFSDGPEDNATALISAWYADHLARGGARDSVMDDLIAEAAAEDARGGGFSHQPGRA
jgi:hypothetical protein